MITLKDCSVKQNVLNASQSEFIEDLSKLDIYIKNPDIFFNEIFITNGIKTVLHGMLDVLKGYGNTDKIWQLRQAMGGGKTLTLTAAGIIASNPQLADKYLEEGISKGAKSARVLHFTGRETPINGIWGHFAEQCGKANFFQRFYSPLSAPGASEWEELLKDQPTVILLDELAPYLFNVKSHSLGTSNLANVTCSALTNLLTAINRLPNCCLIITELQNTYQVESQEISGIMGTLSSELHRSNRYVTPVETSSNDIYDILRKRIFSKLPDSDKIIELAAAYRKEIASIKSSKQTIIEPHIFEEQIISSYPFHPSLKELYLRFKENEGFQQTRGIIRMMCVIVKDLYENNNSEFLIEPFALNLANRKVKEVAIDVVNKDLCVAVTKDLEDQGRAVIEQLDCELSKRAAKLLLVSSLANTPDSKVGLAASDIYAYLAKPGYDLSKLKSVLDTILEKCHYLHKDKKDDLYFSKVENLSAKIETHMASLGQERRFQEIKDQLIEIFKPKTNELYQDISVFNNQNEVINSINPDRIRLVIPEPRSDADAKKWVEETINQAEHKNRLLFLIPKNNRDLLVLAARVRAINAIASDDKSSSYKEELLQKRDRAIQNLYSAIKECYSGLALLVRGGDLVYPDIKFSFTNSDFNGEAQIIAAVSQYGKYLNKATDDDIKTRIETVIFNGVSELTWNEVRDKCSKNTQFPWYKHGRLDEVKRILIESKRWTENSSYIDITGKVQPDIDITLLSSHGNIRHFKFTLHSTDTVYWDTKHPDLNSPKVSNIESFESSELELYFMAALGSVIGKIHVRCGQIIIKKNPIQKDGKTYLELSTTPSDIPIEVMVDGQSFFYKEPFLLTGNAEINASKGAAKANTVYQRIDEKVQATNLYTHSFKVHGVQNINTFLDVSIKYGAVFKDFEFSSLKTSFFIVEDVFDSSKVRDVFNCMLKALDRQDIVFVYENPENPIKFPSIKHREEWENELKGVMK